jgi:hypothetical protein
MFRRKEELMTFDEALKHIPAKREFKRSGHELMLEATKKHLNVWKERKKEEANA